jgi:hypothetical protein
VGLWLQQLGDAPQASTSPPTSSWAEILLARCPVDLDYHAAGLHPITRSPATQQFRVN